MGRIFWTGIVLSVIGVATCVEPTEMHVTLYTDICETLDVAISTDEKPPAAQKLFPRPATCAPHRRLGDIVFVPSNAGRRFTVRARAAAEGGDCAKGLRCVTASRNVAYLEHTSLQLDIDLTSDCIGVQCAAMKTCKSGTCVDDFVDCSKNKTCEQSDAGDASPPLDTGLDAGIVDTGVKDAGGCTPPKNTLNALAPDLYWPFTLSGNSITEQKTGKMATIVNGNFVGPGNMAFGCGDAIAIVGTQPLNVTHGAKGIGASMWVFVPSNSTTTLLLRKLSGMGIQGIVLFVDFQHLFQVQTCDANACSYLVFPALPVDAWTSLEVKAPSSGQMIFVAYDGVAQIATSGYINAGAFTSGALDMGVGDKALVDELRVYDVQ